MSKTSPVQTVLLPNVELNMENVTVTEVFVKPGDAITKGKPLGSVETQKANIEVDSPYSGFVHEVFITVGQEIGEKAPVCTIGEQPPSANSVQNSPVAGKPETPSAAEAKATTPTASTTPTPVGKVRASPLARKVAKTLGVDLFKMTGTGPAGRINRCDVEAFHAQSEATEPVSRISAEKVSVASSGNWQPFAPARKNLIAQMEAAQSIPTFSISRQFDVTPLVRKEAGITFTHRLISCLGKALAKHTSLLTTIGPEGWRIEEVSVAVAMETASGLVAPALRNSQTMSLPEVAANVQLLKARADAGQLKRVDFERAPFALSNLGMFGVDVFQPSVFHGQCAVLGTGRATDSAGGRKVAWFTLACDHRAVDGAEAARFFQTLQHEIYAS